jgi:uncharacterized membrane protein
MADRSVTPLTTAGTFIGIGMGGFFDGIMLHQIFQAHAMLSAKISTDTMEGMQTNMTADGLFHLVTWVATAVGILLLWRAVTRRSTILSGRALFGSTLFGWGLFNLVEGVIDHHLLGLHHVVERLGVSIWDWLFLASGVLLIVIGWVMMRNPRDAHAV